MHPYEILQSNHGVTSYFTILHAESLTTIAFLEKEFTMQKDDVLLLKEGVSWQVNKGKVFVLNCNEDAFDALFYSQIADCRIIHDFLFDQQPYEYLYFSTSKDSSSIQMLNLLKKEARLHDSYHNKMMHLGLVGFLTSLDRSRPYTLLLANSTMLSKNEFGKLLKYMGEHYVDCTLENLANTFGYHPDYLSRKFAKITGESFKQKLLSIRLEKAEELLLTSDLTMEQISREVGFHDKSWFQKKFKEAYQETPSKYRALHQTN